MLDIMVAADAVSAVTVWITDQQAAEALTTPGAFTGLELVCRLAGGTWPTTAALITASEPIPVPVRGALVTDGAVCGIYIGRGKAVVPAGRVWALVDYQQTRLPTVCRLPNVTYTS